MLVGLLALVVVFLVAVSIVGLRTYLALARQSPGSGVLKHYTVLLRHILYALVAVAVALAGISIDPGVLLER